MFAHVIKGFCLCIGQIPKTRQKEHYWLVHLAYLHPDW